MKLLFICLLCFGLVGCTTVSRSQKLENQVNELQGVISKQDQEIKDKDSQLKEKDLKIQELQKKLEGFGVF